MIIREFYMTRKDGVNLYKTSSDKNVYIIKQGTNEKYDEAIDVESAPYIYEETEEIIDYGNKPEIEADNT
nr:MAG TPA: hypothetical protein [Bacteriophage sp.]